MVSIWVKVMVMRIRNLIIKGNVFLIHSFSLSCFCSFTAPYFLPIPILHSLLWIQHNLQASFSLRNFLSQIWLSNNLLKQTCCMPPLTSLPPSGPHPQIIPKNSKAVPGKQWSCRWPAWRLTNTCSLVQRMEKGTLPPLQSLQFTRWKFQQISSS